jgi:hypothetical protein
MSSEIYTDIGKPDIPTKITRTRVCVCVCVCVLGVAMAHVVVRRCSDVVEGVVWRHGIGHAVARSTAAS